LGLSQDSSTPKIEPSASEACIAIMIFFTLLAGYTSTGLSLDPFPLVIALGLSTIAASILHLARVMQKEED
jgi:hypothetical protein